MTNQLVDATSKLIEILSPLNPEERARTVNAVFALLGEAVPTGTTKGGGGEKARGRTGIGDDESLPSLVQAWARKHAITLDQLEEHLHLEHGEATPISLPGVAKARAEQVVNAYLVQGLASFVSKGEPSFTDEEARKLCERLGCYDSTNHAKYLKGFGNRITGSKTMGWKLTAPGLAAIAVLIKGA